MKIVSSFRDYYDNAVGYDSDVTRVYIREEREIPVASVRFGTISRIVSWLENLSRQRAFSRAEAQIEDRVIGFCGKLHFIHTYLGIHYLSEEYEKCYAEYWKRIEDFPWNRFRRRYNALDRGAKQYRELMASNVTEMLSDRPFLELDTPIFLVSRLGSPANVEQILTNPRLGIFGFQRMYDPWSAYQAIETYIGNQLAKQADPSSDFSDDLKAHAHGFNEWSFRRQAPGERKKRRRDRRKHE